MMEKENTVIWKDIKNYVGKYQVSNRGEIKSLKRKRVPKTHLRKLVLNKGYKKVSLTSKDARLVSHLVAEAFLGYIKPSRYIIVDHINGVKSDNNVENLQVITQRENILRRKINKSSKYANVHLNKDNKWVAQYSANTISKRYIGIYTSEEEAHKAVMVKISTISS